MKTLCPTCGHQIAPLELDVCAQSNTVGRMGRRVRISPQQRVLLEALLAPNPLRPVHVDELRRVLHGAKAATKKRNQIYQEMARLNHRLAPLSVRIECWSGVGYRIQIDDIAHRKQVAA